MKDKLCKACGASFTPPTHNARYCQFCRREDGGGLRESLKRHPPIACQWCGEEFVPRDVRRRCCSPECGNAQSHASRTARAKRDRATRKFVAAEVRIYRVWSARAAAIQRKQRKRQEMLARRRAGNCQRCGQEFKTNQPQKKYCSEHCATRASKTRQKQRRRAARARAFIEHVSPFKVFERDNWRCQLCGRKTARKYRGKPHDDAPERRPHQTAQALLEPETGPRQSANPLPRMQPR